MPHFGNEAKIKHLFFSEVGAKLVNLMKRLDYLSLSSLTQSPFVDAIESVSYYDDMDILFQAMLSALGKNPLNFRKVHSNVNIAIAIHF